MANLGSSVCFPFFGPLHDQMLTTVTSEKLKPNICLDEGFTGAHRGFSSSAVVTYHSLNTCLYTRSLIQYFIQLSLSGLQC